MRFAGHLLLCSSTSLFDPMLTWWSKKVLIGQTCDLSKNKEQLMKFKQRRQRRQRQRQRQRQNNKRFFSKTKSLHVHHAFLYISLPLLRD